MPKKLIDGKNVEPIHRIGLSNNSWSRPGPAPNRKDLMAIIRAAMKQSTCELPRGAKDMGAE